MANCLTTRSAGKLKISIQIDLGNEPTEKIEKKNKFVNLSILKKCQKSVLFPIIK